MNPTLQQDTKNEIEEYLDEVVVKKIGKQMSTYTNDITNEIQELVNVQEEIITAIKNRPTTSNIKDIMDNQQNVFSEKLQSVTAEMIKLPGNVANILQSPLRQISAYLKMQFSIIENDETMNLNEYLVKKFDSFDSRIDKIDSNIKIGDEKIDAIISRLETIESYVRALDGFSVKTQNSQVSTLLKQLDCIEEILREQLCSDSPKSVGVIIGEKIENSEALTIKNREVLNIMETHFKSDLEMKYEEVINVLRMVDNNHKHQTVKQDKMILTLIGCNIILIIGIITIIIR